MWNEESKIKKYSILPGTFGISFKEIVSPYDIHCHDFCEFEIFKSGTGTQIINGIEYDIRPGSVAFLKHGDLHQLAPHTGNSVKNINIYFDYTLLRSETWKILHAINSPIVITLSGDEFAHAEEICTFLRSATQNSDINMHYIRSGLDWILAILLQKSSEEGSRISSVSTPIYEAITYIHKNFSKQITLSEVAQHLHYAPQYFSQYFHKATGITFRKYLLDTRLRFAMVLLKMSDLSITDICFESGFTSLSHFSNAFSLKYGQSPKFFLGQTQSPENIKKTKIQLK